MIGDFAEMKVQVINVMKNDMNICELSVNFISHLNLISPSTDTKTYTISIQFSHYGYFVDFSCLVKQ